MLSKEEKIFWRTIGIKAFCTWGFTFFSTLTALQLSGIQNLGAVFYSSFIGAGAYFFLELTKYYKIQPDKKVISPYQKKLYNFII